MAGMLFFSSSPLAHGVRGHLYQGPYLGIEASYSDGLPMSYARVRVFFNREKIPFQTGVTDRNGRFLFAPDRKGPYRIVIEDGEGHRLEMELEAKEGVARDKSYAWEFFLLRAGGGLLLLFLFFWGLRLLFARKEKAQG